MIPGGRDHIGPITQRITLPNPRREPTMQVSQDTPGVGGVPLAINGGVFVTDEEAKVLDDESDRIDVVMQERDPHEEWTHLVGDVVTHEHRPRREDEDTCTCGASMFDPPYEDKRTQMERIADLFGNIAFLQELELRGCTESEFDPRPSFDLDDIEHNLRIMVDELDSVADDMIAMENRIRLYGSALHAIDSVTVQVANIVREENARARGEAEEEPEEEAEPEQPVVFQDVVSSNVLRMGYRTAEQEMLVVFGSSPEIAYVYEGIDAETFHDVLHAPSIGKAIAPYRNHPHRKVPISEITGE